MGGFSLSERKIIIGVGYTKIIILSVRMENKKNKQEIDNSINKSKKLKSMFGFLGDCSKEEILKDLRDKHDRF